MSFFLSFLVRHFRTIELNPFHNGEKKNRPSKSKYSKASEADKNSIITTLWYKHVYKSICLRQKFWPGSVHNPTTGEHRIPGLSTILGWLHPDHTSYTPCMYHFGHGVKFSWTIFILFLMKIHVAINEKYEEKIIGTHFLYLNMNESWEIICQIHIFHLADDVGEHRPHFIFCWVTVHKP